MSPKPRVKRKKLTLTLKDKNEIIKRVDHGDCYNKLSSEYGIGRSTIYDIYKNRKGIEKAATMPYKSQRKTLREPENPELEKKLYEWYIAERRLYPMTGSLMMVKARTIHRELTGKDDFLASSGWLDRFKKRNGIVLGVRGLPPPESEQTSYSSGTTSKAASPAEPLTDPLGDARDVIKVARTPSGNQLVIRVSDKLDSKTNVFNRFSVSDGHFENNIIVKEEREDPQPDNEESSENMETEGPRHGEYSQSEDMFPPAEAVLGNEEDASETCKALKELNETLRLFMAEYSERTQLERERTQLERERLKLDQERLKFDMEVFRSKNCVNKTNDNS